MVWAMAPAENTVRAAITIQNDVDPDEFRDMSLHILASHIWPWQIASAVYARYSSTPYRITMTRRHSTPSFPPIVATMTRIASDDLRPAK